MVGAARRQERRGADHAVRHHRLRDEVRVRGEGLGAVEVVRQARAQAPRSLPAVRRRGRHDGGRRRGPRHAACRRARSIAGAATSARASAACGRSRTPTPRSKAKGPRHGFSPYFVTDIIINELPGMVSIRTGATGPNISHVSACATGAHSIGEAIRTIRHGYADGMICRRRRGDDHDPRRRRLQRDARDVDAQRRPDAREPAVRQGPRRLRDRRGRRRRRARGARAREEARRADLRRARSATARTATRTTSRRRRPSTRARRRASSVALDDAKLDAERRSATSTRTARRPTSTTRTRRSRSRRCSATTRRSSRCRRPSR